MDWDPIQGKSWAIPLSLHATKTEITSDWMGHFLIFLFLNFSLFHIFIFHLHVLTRVPPG